MLVNESTHVARSSHGAGSHPRPSPISRRALMVSVGSVLTSAVILGQTKPAHSYGGQKQLAAMDAGSGNRDYDDLMKAIKARRAEAAPAPPKPEPKAPAKP